MKLQITELYFIIEDLMSKQSAADDRFEKVQSQILTLEQNHDKQPRSSLVNAIMNRNIASNYRHTEQLGRYVAELTTRLASIEVLLADKSWPVRGSNPRHSRY